MIQTDQKYSYGPGSTLYRPGSTPYRPESNLYSPWSFPDGPRDTLNGPRSTLYCPGRTLEVGVGFLWLEWGGLGSFTSLTNLMRGVYKRRALAPCDFYRYKSHISTYSFSIWIKIIDIYQVSPTILFAYSCRKIIEIINWSPRQVWYNSNSKCNC